MSFQRIQFGTNVMDTNGFYKRLLKFYVIRSCMLGRLHQTHTFKEMHQWLHYQWEMPGEIIYFECLRVLPACRALGVTYCDGNTQTTK